MKKDRLLTALQELIYVEEGMVGMYANFSMALVRETKELDGEKKKELQTILSRLNMDSSRHKDMIVSLVNEIRQSDKDEY